MGMKKYVWVVLLAISGLASSCNFTEEITVEEDGSGSVALQFDGSQMMQIAGDQISESGEKDIDSVITFASFLDRHKDSIAQLEPKERERLEKLRPFTMHMEVKSKEQIMNFDISSTFTKIENMSDVYKAFQDASKFGDSDKNANPSAEAAYQDGTDVSYHFSGNTFERRVRVVDSTLYKAHVDSLQSVAPFLANSTFTLKYHFPKKIRSTSQETATFSADGKTLFFTVPFMDYMKDPQRLALTVELQD